MTGVKQWFGRGVRPEWVLAQPPSVPRVPPTLDVVADAYLTPVHVGHLATVRRPRQWFEGAVYDHTDTLVRSSQKIRAYARDMRVASDPDHVSRPADVPVLEGRWTYGGTWANVFGHFLVETLSTLWPSPTPRPDGLVFHASFGEPQIKAWHRRFLELAGYGDLPVHVVDRDSGVRVDELSVPGRALSLHAWAHPQARTVWERVAAGFRGQGDELLYVSRTRLNRKRRRHGHRRPIRTTEAHDRALDAVFAARGFTVVHPEQLSIDEQLAAVGSARVLAGLSGSGLHQSVFMPSGGRVLEIGDARDGERPVPMQVAVDAVMEHERHFVPGHVTPRDLERRLDRLGLRRPRVRA